MTEGEKPMTDDRGPCITLPLEWVELALAVLSVYEQFSGSFAYEHIGKDSPEIVSSIQSEVDQVREMWRGNASHPHG